MTKYQRMLLAQLVEMHDSGRSPIKLGTTSERVLLRDGYAEVFDTWYVRPTDKGRAEPDADDRTIADIRTTRDQAIAYRIDEMWRAAAVADSPELAQALRERDGLSAMVEELEAGTATIAAELAQASAEIDRLRTIAADAMLEGNEGTDWYSALRDIADAEHGYAPDEARIRADERARTEREIAAELLRLGNDGGCSWCGEQWSEAVAKSDYPREGT